MSLTHEIHSSQLRGYRRCRRMWNWRYRENWEPVKKPAPLEDGTVWHKALEVLYNPDTWTRPLQDLHAEAQAALLAEADAQRLEYLKRSAKYQLDEEEALAYMDRVSILRSMLVKLCRSLDRERFKPLFVEREFECPIIDPVTGGPIYCRCAECFKQFAATGQYYKYEGDFPGLPVVFNCRIDAVFEDREGFIFAVDHKSAAQLYKPDSVVPELEDQLPSYLWCLRQNAYPVTGAILNQFRKACPKPPKRLQQMNQGRLYSTNRLQLTDYHTARQVFQRHDARAHRQGLYNEYLEWLKDHGPEYARQFMTFKSQEQLDEIGREIALQTQEVLSDSLAIYRSPNKMNCDGCSFQLPCLTASAGGDFRSDLEASFVQSEPYYIQRRRQS